MGDVIRLGKSTTVKKAVKNGKDYVLTIGSNKITLKNAANKVITVVNTKNEYSNYNESAYMERFYMEREDEVLWFDNGTILAGTAMTELESILVNNTDKLSVTGDNLNISANVNELGDTVNSFLTYTERQS